MVALQKKEDALRWCMVNVENRNKKRVKVYDSVSSDDKELYQDA